MGLFKNFPIFVLQAQCRSTIVKVVAIVLECLMNVSLLATILN